MSSKFVYFTSLTLENVRAFRQRQTLSLTTSSDSSAPARWTLIIGENGVGKTSLLQCLANMRPVASARTSIDKSAAAPKTCVDPAFTEEFDNDKFDALTRAGDDVDLNLRANFSVGSQLDSEIKTDEAPIFTSLEVKRENRKVEKITEDGSEYADFSEPLVIGYGASRHMGYENSKEVAATAAVASLFEPGIELIDAERTLLDLDHSRLLGDPDADSRLAQLKAALATILPDIQENPENIQIKGPKSAGLSGKGGVHAQTPYGLVPLSSLSLGYQTMTAWTIDLALRLSQKYPESKTPLSEPAIVLIDEIDLHLHPKWQRKVRSDLSKHFPNVQFIATAHSPLMAQTYLDANLAVIRRENDQAVIFNDPEVIQGWRLDQVITSELFGFESARSPDIEAKIQRRIELIQSMPRTPDEEIELQDLDRALEDLPSEESAADNEALKIIRRAAKALTK